MGSARTLALEMEEELEAIERGVQRREPASKKCGTKIMFYQLLGASTPLSTPLEKRFYN